MPKKPKAILLMGPSAVGKTDLAIAISKNFPCEIISVDSAMIYRQMDIGTAKPDKKTLQIAPHCLIDIRDPAESYSAADFCKDAEKEMDAIIAKGAVPLLTGGTMMYFYALQHGIARMPSADLLLREKLQERLNTKGVQQLHSELSTIDPMAANKININDPQRIIRALEVYELTGKPISQLQQENLTNAIANSFDLLKIAIEPITRVDLHKQIKRRFYQMLNDGFVDEVNALKSRGDLHAELPSMKAVGYRQIWQYLDNQYNYDTMIEKSIAATRQLAKRQFTWLRKESHINKYLSDEAQLHSITLIEKFLLN